MKPQRAANAAFIKAIHASRRKVRGLEDDETWRAFLERVTGCRSLRAMTVRQLGQVLDELHARGAPRASTSSARVPSTGSGRGRPAVALNAQAAKARALWRDLYELGEVASPDDRALDAFVAGPKGPGVASLRWCDSAQLNHVIEALKEWCARAGFVVPDTSDGGRRALEALMNAQWARLKALGALRLPQAHLWTWLNRYGVQHPQFLSDADAQRAVGELGEWIRRTKAQRPSTSSGRCPSTGEDVDA